MRRNLLAAVVASALILDGAALAGGGVLTSPRLNEAGPASEGDFLVWTQSRRAHPGRWRVFAREGGGNRFRVSPRGKRAFSGGIEGNLLLYQVVSRGQSNIKAYNLDTRNRVNVAPAINTRRWEFHPTISGDFVLFGRQSRRRDKIILFNRETRNSRLLASVRGGRGRLTYPGQVNGNFAVWNKCTRQGCDVFRYNVAQRSRMRIPKERTSQYAASVAPDGTTYFARSGLRCGTNVTLHKRANGNTSRIGTVGDRDLLFTYADTSGGPTDLYYESARCARDGSGLARRPNFNVLLINNA